MISGLDDVVVAETVLSDVDGQAGRLVIRGHSLDDLVGHATYERWWSSLWEGFFEGLTRARGTLTPRPTSAQARQKAFRST